MPLPVIADCMRVAIKGICPNGQPWVNVMHFNRPGTNTVPVDAALINAELAKLYSVAGYGAGKPGWAANFSSHAAVQEAQYIPLDGISATVTVPLAIVGNSGGDALPSDTALVITHRTGLRGRSFRGRTYWAGGTEAANQSFGTFSPPTITQYIDTWRAFQAALTVKDCAHLVASYKLSVATVVQDYSIDGKWDRQSRRKG